MPQSSQLVAIPVQLRHGSEERWLLENWHAARSRAQKKGSCEIQLWPLLCADLGLSEHSTRCQDVQALAKKELRSAAVQTDSVRLLYCVRGCNGQHQPQRCFNVIN